MWVNVTVVVFITQENKLLALPLTHLFHHWLSIIQKRYVCLHPIKYVDLAIQFRAIGCCDLSFLLRNETNNAFEIDAIAFGPWLVYMNVVARSSFKLDNGPFLLVVCLSIVHILRCLGRLKNNVPLATQSA